MKNPNICTIHTGNITVLANVFRQLSHEGDTEAANFVVTLALRVEVGSTLTSTHVKSGESILEGLLKSKELKDGKVNRGVKTETALVRTESRVVLHSTGIHMRPHCFNNWLDRENLTWTRKPLLTWGLPLSSSQTTRN